MRQIRNAYENHHAKTPLHKMLILWLLGSVSLLALPLPLFAAQDGEDATAQLQKAMIHAAKNDPGRLSEYEERIADVFCEAAENGLETELIGAFAEMWASLNESDPAKNPQFASLPAKSKQKIRAATLSILDRYFNKLQEIDARSDRSLKLFDALQSLVLPSTESPVVVLGWHEDGGGQGGFYRTFAEYLVKRAIAENRLDDLATAVKQCRDKIAAKQKDSDKLTDQEKRSLTEAALKCDLIEMLVALQQGDKEQIATLKKRFSDAIKKNELPNSQAANWAIFALVPAYGNADLFAQVDDLLQEATDSLEAANRFPRYYNYLMPQILPTAVKHSKLARAVALARAYRKFYQKRLTATKCPDHVQFAANSQLYNRALATDSPAELLTVVNYFSELPVDHARRPKLLPLLDRLESTIDDLPKQERESLLGDVDLAAIRKAEASRKFPTPRGPLTADGAGLPKLPSGKLFFSDNFNESVNPAWSSDCRDMSPNRAAIFLGEFMQEKLQLRLSDLPPHKLVRVRFDLITNGGTDGLMGFSQNDKENSFGPDYWELYTGDQLRLIATTFSNFNNDPYDQKQSYPDDFPLAFGVKPTWYDRFQGTGESLWADDLEMGYRRGRAGAAADGSLDLERSATYAVDLLFPHEDKTLELNFRDDYRDGRYIKGELSLTAGENWALDNVRIELVDRFWDASPEELSKCLDALSRDDPTAANAARWRLVAAGDKAVEQLESFSQTAKGKALAKRPESFVRFRIERVLDIIGTDRAKQLRKKWFGPDPAWENKNLPHDPWQVEN